MTMNQPRRSVKAEDRPDRASSLKRLREECSERFAKDRDALRQRLRADTAALGDAIRKSIRSDDTYDGIDEDDIDRLVAEFLADLQSEEYADAFPDEEIDEYPTHPPEWVKCPLCESGWLFVPFPGSLACDGCTELQLSLPSDEFTVNDFAAVLDRTVVFHQVTGCVGKVDFSVNENILSAACRRCGISHVVNLGT